MDTIEIFLADDELLEVLFGALPREVAQQDPVLFGAVDLEQNKIVGVLAILEDDADWVIEYIEVSAAWRHRGIGSDLIECAISYARGIFVENLVLSYVHVKGDPAGESLTGFFKALGFARAGKKPICRCAVKNINEEKLSVEEGRLPGRMVPLYLVKEREWEEFQKRILRLGENHEAEKKNSRREQIFMELGDMSDYHPRISMMNFDAQDRPNGCLLMQQREGGITISYLFATGSSLDRSFMVPMMIREAVLAARDYLDPEKYIYADLQNSMTKKYFRMVFNRKEENYADSIELIRSI